MQYQKSHPERDETSGISWGSSAAYIEDRIRWFERFLQLSDIIRAADSRERYRRIRELCEMAVQFGDACLNDLVRGAVLAYRQAEGPRALVLKLHAMDEYCRNNRAYYRSQLLAINGVSHLKKAGGSVT